MIIMKTILAVLLFISFSLYGADKIHNQNGSDFFEVNENPCLPIHEKAEEVLRDYLSKEQTIEGLTTRYGIEIDQTSHKEVYALKNESDAAECQKLIENFEYLEEKSEYSNSIYKVENHYFIVRFSLNNNEFDWESISIIDSDFEVVAVALNW